MDAFEFGRFVKQSAGPMQGLKNMGHAANDWSAKNLGLAVPNRAELGQAYGNAANKAIQSRPGQAVLGGVSKAYNNYMPQTGKNFVSRQMPNYYTDSHEQQFYRQEGLKAQPAPFQQHREDVGAHINSNTQTQNDELVKDEINTYTPATNFGTPLQQIGYGLRNNEMPGQTFKPGDQASWHVGVNNDQLVHDRLVPGQYDQQMRTDTPTQQSAPQSFGRWVGSKLGM